ncbi:hypothetical protein Syun_003807 [Stephania yunnanensis]|uniref:Uncharacterized protein n=1 Tax=Stephania yunnanensis TaxID=152371 RepID=A0AAP0L2U5_9MAGN
MEKSNMISHPYQSGPERGSVYSARFRSGFRPRRRCSPLRVRRSSRRRCPLRLTEADLLYLCQQFFALKQKSSVQEYQK